MESWVQIIFWLIAAPFWLAWKIITFLWEHAFKPLIEHRSDKRAEKTQQQLSQQNEDKQKARADARAEQLEALRAAVPSGLPERMRATIQINEYRQARHEQQRIGRLIAEDAFVSVEVGEMSRFSVDMILQLSETERAIIKEHELDGIVLDESSFYTEEEVLDTERKLQERINATRDLVVKEIIRQDLETRRVHMREKRSQTRVGDLLVSPFARDFGSPHEAKDYADKLKTKLLPAVSELIDSYRQHKQTETIEF